MAGGLRHSDALTSAAICTGATDKRTRAMTHPAEALITETLSALRDASLDGAASTDTHLIPNLYVSWDSAEGEVAVTVTSEPGQLCSISAQVAKAPRWFSLNLVMGTARFAPGDVLGLVARTATNTDLHLPIFVRSGHDGSVNDTALPGSLTVEGSGGVASIVHMLTADSPLAWGEGFHTLVIGLPAHDFELDLQDLRIFVLPASDTAELQPHTLASFGG